MSELSASNELLEIITVGDSHEKAYIDSLRANRAVLERHRPASNLRGGFMCEECSRNKYIEDIEDFPCPTYVDVRDGLGLPHE